MGENAGLQGENITINAICPSFVPTGLAPPEMLKCNPFSENTDNSDEREIPTLYHSRLYYYQSVQHVS